MNTLESWGEQLARALLREPLPRRWAHVQAVAAQARGLAPVLGTDADRLEAAAWLHDIGYASGLADTGLHQLDGARYLRDAQHADAMLCRLVAHQLLRHNRSRRTRARLCPEFRVRPCTGRTGQRADVLRHDHQSGRPARAGRQAARRDTRSLRAGHLVSRSIQRATPMIRRAVEQIHQRAVQTT